MHRTRQIFWGLMGMALWIWFFTYLSLSTPESQVWERIHFWALVAWGVIGLISFLGIAGFRRVLPNKVRIGRGATQVCPRLLAVEDLTMVGMGVCTVLVGLANTFFDGPTPLGRAGITGVVLGPFALGVGFYMIFTSLWKRLRGVRMTPDTLTYWRGLGRITLGWNELGEAIPDDNVLNLRPTRAHHLLFKKEFENFSLGATIVIPAYRAAETLLEVRWDDDGTARLVLDTEHFRVEPSALLTAILAMRDHPELREKLGTRESKTFFVGPPWRVRRHLYRNQQWWPKGAAPDGVEVDADGVVKEPVPRLELS